MGTEYLYKIEQLTVDLCTGIRHLQTTLLRQWRMRLGNPCRSSTSRHRCQAPTAVAAYPVVCGLASAHHEEHVLVAGRYVGRSGLKFGHSEQRR